MIEVYAFLAMVMIQILTGSVLVPTLFIRRVRTQVADFPRERFAELFPGVDRDRSRDRFTTRYRAWHTAIALLGVAFVGWLFLHMQRPDWNPQKIAGLLTVYLLLQMSPLAFVGLKAGRSMKALKAKLAGAKRKAVLERRGLFDFVSPLTIILAVLSYLLLVALVLYIRQHPFPGFGGFTNLVIITAVWAFYALLVYGCLYGRNRNPLATHADRLRVMGVVVNAFVYTAIGATLFASLVLALSLFHLQRWELFAVSAFFVITTLCGSIPVLRPNRLTVATTHAEISLPAAELDRCIGHYDLGNNFTIAIASDGEKLWWLRLGISEAQPVPIFAEAPLLFFWKDIDQQIRFITDTKGAVTGAEVTNGGQIRSGRRVESAGSASFSPATESASKPA